MKTLCFGRQDHQVQRDRFEAHFPMLRPSPLGAQERIQQPLQHREKTFHLPTLAVKLFRPMLMPEAAIKSAGDVMGIPGGTTSGWRDDSQHAEFLEQESLMMLAVESHVAGQGLEAVP